MESAIDRHLICPRTLSRRVPDNYQPPFSMWVGRADAALERVVNCHPRTGMMRDARIAADGRR